MNIKKISLYFTLLVIQLTQIPALANNGYFTKSNVESGIASAAEAKKLLIVHFMADWCMPSQWMERYTFGEAPVNQLLSEEFLCIKVDVDAIEGHQDKETYQISTLPCILIFNPAGEELTRLEGITNASTLLEHLHDLKQSDINMSAPPPNKYTKLSASLPSIDFSHLDRPAFIPNKLETEVPIIAELAESPMQTAGKKRQYFGIEVAVLQQYSAVIRYVSHLENRLSQKVYIKMQQEEQQKTYRVIVGKFQERKAAFRLLDKLKKLHIRGKMTDF